MHHRRNHIIITAICFLAVVFCGSFKEADERLTVDAKITACRLIKGGRYIEVLTSITNNTNDTISFWIMSCGWLPQFRVDNEAFEFNDRTICDKNIPMTVDIAPRSTIQCVLQVVSLISVKLVTNELFRVGFRFSEWRKGEVNDSIKWFDAPRSGKTILWSPLLNARNLRFEFANEIPESVPYFFN